MTKSKAAMFAAAQGFGEKNDTSVEEIKVIEKSVTTEKPKVKTKQVSVEVIEEDLSKLEAAVVRLSSRDNTLYKKKDIHIAMVRYFLDAVEKNIISIKMEKF